MKNYYFILFFLLSFNNVFADIPSNAHSFDFHIRMDKSIEIKRERKVLSAVAQLKEIFKSEEFKRKVLNHKFRGRRSFQYNRGLSNHEIYHKILIGAEKLYPYRNNRMDVWLRFYTNYDSIVLGFTKPTSSTVWINTKFFNRHAPSRVAGNIMHEWLHKLGFHHKQEKEADRKYSVPYAIGKIVGDMAHKIERGFTLY